MLQPDLFAKTTEDRIREAMVCPVLFFSVTEAMEILSMTDSMVRTAISMYRLDALVLASQYRIPRNAIVRYWNTRQSIREQWLAYDAWCASRANNLGVTFHHPMMPLDSDGAFEDAPEDYYDLSDLPFPEAAGIDTWALLLRVPTGYLEREIGRPFNRDVDYLTVFDFMVGREMVNLPVGIEQSNLTKKNELGTASQLVQLELFWRE